MVLARFKQNNTLHYGLVEGDRIRTIEGDIFDPEFVLAGQDQNLNQLELLAPCIPSKIIAVGLNYTDHARELGMALPKEPLVFMKPPSAVIGHRERIVYPEGIGRLDYEAELGIVIKKPAKDIDPGQAADYILGYTCLNDVTARDLQKRDGQWTRAKSFDTFCPTGPFIVTGIEPEGLMIQLFLNKEIKQSSSTKNMIFSPRYLVSFVSRICTLFPGDIIATGTPSGVGPMDDGDEVEVRIESIGSLINTVSRRNIG